MTIFRRSFVFILLLVLLTAGVAVRSNILGGNDKVEPLTLSANTDTTEEFSDNEPAVLYRIVQHGINDPVWKISISGKGFAGLDKPLRLRLENWGEWQDVDDYYLRELTAKPAIRRDTSKAGEFLLDVPTGWDGAFEVSYTIPIARVGSAINKRLHLLPSWNEYAAGGYSVNTLMHVDAGDRAIRRIAQIVPPKGLFVASGWGGLSRGEQKAPILGPANEMDNTPILIGMPSRQHIEKHDGVAYEAVQFGPGNDLTADALQVAKAVVSLYERHSGYSSKQPVRIFFVAKPGGATGLRSAFISTYDPDDKWLTPAFKHLMAHELFHRWLGADFVRANEAIAWFHEGFTDYLSLWHCAAAGVIDYDYFSSRMSAIDAEARRASAYRKVSFAQEGVRWRSGSNEELAYRGGAVLAFLIDVELRKQGRPGLMQMIADLGAQKSAEPVTLSRIRAWMEEHGLGSIYKTHVESKGLPPIGDLLAVAGFSPKEVPVELTYFGIREENGWIVELDPEGPAAKAGFRVGDQFIGRYPGYRSERVSVSEQVTTKFRYALEIIEPGIAGTSLDVKRGKEELTIRVQPSLIQGGLASRYEADVPKLKKFFAFQPEKTDSGNENFIGRLQDQKVRPLVFFPQIYGY